MNESNLKRHGTYGKDYRIIKIRAVSVEALDQIRVYHTKTTGRSQPYMDLVEDLILREYKRIHKKQFHKESTP